LPHHLKTDSSSCWEDVEKIRKKLKSSLCFEH
jgi:hypothetical protein